MRSQTHPGIEDDEHHDLRARSVEMTSTEKFLLGAIALLVLMIAAQFAWLAIVTNRVGVTEQNVIESRAVACRVLLSLGQPILPDGPCSTSEVLRYYNPTETRTAAVSTVDTEAICDIARHLEVRPTPEVCR